MKVVLSASVEPEYRDAVRLEAFRTGASVSEIINDFLATRYPDAYEAVTERLTHEACIKLDLDPATLRPRHPTGPQTPMPSRVTTEPAEIDDDDSSLVDWPTLR